jgi:hypothetical protein
MNGSTSSLRRVRASRRSRLPDKRHSERVRGRAVAEIEVVGTAVGYAFRVVGAVVAFVAGVLECGLAT